MTQQQQTNYPRKEQLEEEGRKERKEGNVPPQRSSSGNREDKQVAGRESENKDKD